MRSMQIEGTGRYVTESLTADPRVREHPGPGADIGVVTGKAPTYSVESSLASLSSYAIYVGLFFTSR